MNKRQLAVTLIKDKLDNKSTLTYSEIATLSGLHQKYVLKLKKQIIDNTLNIEHGNKNKKPHNAISKEEEQFIISLYKRSTVNVKKFSNFYGKRSYSCIYSILKRNNLI